MGKHGNFRVIIAGGGLAGLTLANALQHTGIDYLLLESRSVIAPQVGGSIGLAPNGSRILDQLSCYEEVEKLTEPVESMGNHAANGDDILPRSDGFQLLHARTNYPVSFLDRQIILRILAGHILDKKKILLNRQVSKVDHSTKGVIVHCTDNSFYNADIVVGADGVYSKVRQEMWRAADALEPGEISKGEQNSMLAEYKCLFGISSPTNGVLDRSFEVTYRKDMSTMVITGKGNRVFWFVFARMSQIYRTSEIPRFSKADAEEFAEQNLEIPILPQGVVKFGDIWRNRETYALVATEEADYDHWTWGRFACLGDSIHKMTPNMGAGGMAAIESAAALANAIHSLRTHNHGSCPSMREVRLALISYQQSRKFRASEIGKASNDLTRIQSLKGLRERILVRYVIPNAGDYLVDTTSDGWIGATLLNYLPPPPRSLTGNMPFNPDQGLGRKESHIHRAFVSLPFLAMSVSCFYIIRALIPWESGGAILRSGKIEWDNSFSIPILENMYHVKTLDDFCRGASVLMAPSTLGYDPGSSFQMFTFLADIGLVYSIFLIESARRANFFTIAQIPVVFGMAALSVGVGVVMPFYYFLHYATTPIARFSASDMRLTDLNYTLSVLPVTALSYYVPYLVSFLAQDRTNRHAAVWLWKMSPILATLGQWLLARTIMPQPVQHDRIHNVASDLRVIRITVGTLATLSGAIWLHTLFSAPFPISTLFIPSAEGLGTFVGAVQELLKYDQLFFAGSSILWILYLLSDLKEAGMMQESWGAILGVMIVLTVLSGPGAATAAGWLWREEILATKRHKGALVIGCQAMRAEKGSQACLPGH